MKSIVLRLILVFKARLEITTKRNRIITKTIIFLKKLNSL